MTPLTSVQTAVLYIDKVHKRSQKSSLSIIVLYR